MRASVFVVSTLSALLTACIAYAGAWSQKQGRGQLITTANLSNAAEFYNGSGKKNRQASYQKYELSPYVEYGLTDGITLGGSSSLQYATQSNNTNFGLGDSELFARFHMLEFHGFAISLQPLIKLPAFSSLSTDSNPLLGSRHFDGELGALAGYGFDLFGQHHFIDTSVGYRHRLGAPKDQIKFTATTGFSLFEDWVFLSQLYVTRRTGSPANTTFTQSSGDDYDQTKLQLSAVYKLSDAWSLQAGAFTNLEGKNIGNGKGALFSIWRNF